MDSKTTTPPNSQEDTARTISREPPLPGAPAAPVDADWAQRERAAKGRSSGDDEEDDDVYGDPSKVKDEGILDSIGEAVSAPVLDAADEKPDAKKR